MIDWERKRSIENVSYDEYDRIKSNVFGALPLSFLVHDNAFILAAQRRSTRLRYMSTVRKRGDFFLNNILLMQVHGKKKRYYNTMQDYFTHQEAVVFSWLGRSWVSSVDVGRSIQCLCMFMCMHVCGERKQSYLISNQIKMWYVTQVLLSTCLELLHK